MTLTRTIIILQLAFVTLFTVSCGGGTNATDHNTTDTNTNNETVPSISNLQVLARAATTASISWETGVATSATVEYGQSTNYNSNQPGNNIDTNHTIYLTGLIPSTTYNYRVISEDSVGNITMSTNQQFTTQAQSASCQKGVDCYCDNHPELLFCEDFADGTFGNVTGGCSNNGGPWPNCNYMRHAPTNSGGYHDAFNGINDNGAVLTTILTRSSGQMSSSLSMSLPTPLTDGEGSFGVLMKAGPTFWEAFTSATKFIAFRPSSADPRQVAYLRTGDTLSRNGCTPGTYSVVMASGGGGAAINYDEFGNTNPWDANCQHTIKLGNNLANQWVYIEWEIHAASSGLENVLHIYLQDGTVMRSYAPVMINTTQYSVALFHWQTEPTSMNPDSDSYVFIDLMRVSTSFMGPPAGFIE